MITLIQNANNYLDRVALRSDGASCTYRELLGKSESIALELLDGKHDLQEARIAFLVAPGIDYASIQWGIWRAGGIAVPLCEKHPFSAIKYVLEDASISAIVFSPEFEGLLAPLLNNEGFRLIRSEQIEDRQGNLPQVELTRRAMILYTSGTTGLPKGVVTTHQNIEAQITSLVTSWKWTPNDHILNVLPLHHVHGIVNVLGCALWSGACCQFLPKFDPDKVFEIFCENEANLFMAVPTIYYKMISRWRELPGDVQKKISESLKSFRLMVSGSAALPVTVLENWKQISSQTLLERYGMTEIGMAVSNPYRGERKPGYIGQPLASVHVRLADEKDQPIIDGTPGEIQVQGPNVFKEYWGQPEATQESFTPDGWFKTGDIAVLENQNYRILGRNSVDIIKSGGYKISALEIEEVLRTHAHIKDCAVVGIPDAEWGEIIAACLVLQKGNVHFEQLTDWLKDRLPTYKIPRKYLVQDDLPRNVMGKVTKKELKRMFASH